MWIEPEGQHHSTGSMTVDLNGLAEKLPKAIFQDSAAPILHLLAFAVACKPTRINIRVTRGRLEIAFDGLPLGEHEMLMAQTLLRPQSQLTLTDLGLPSRLNELSVAICGLAKLPFRRFELYSGGRVVQADRRSDKWETKLKLHDSPNQSISITGKGWPLHLQASKVLARAKDFIFQRFCQCHVPILLNGIRVDWLPPPTPPQTLEFSPTTLHFPQGSSSAGHLPDQTGPKDLTFWGTVCWRGSEGSPYNLNIISNGMLFVETYLTSKNIHATLWLDYLPRDLSQAQLRETPELLRLAQYVETTFQRHRWRAITSNVLSSHDGYATALVNQALRESDWPSCPPDIRQDLLGQKTLWTSRGTTVSILEILQDWPKPVTILRGPTLDFIASQDPAIWEQQSDVSGVEVYPYSLRSVNLHLPVQRLLEAFDIAVVVHQLDVESIDTMEVERHGFHRSQPTGT